MKSNIDVITKSTRIEFLVGTDIRDATREALLIALESETTVIFYFNKRKYVIYPEAIIADAVNNVAVMEVSDDR